MYKIEKNTAFYSSLRELVFFQQIPLRFENSHPRSFLTRFILTRVLFITNWCGLPVLHLAASIKGNFEVDISEDISGPITVGSILLSGGLFTLQYKKWSTFFVDVTDYTKFGRPANTNKLVKHFNLISVIFATYCVCGCTMYGASGYIESLKCEQLTLAKGFVCGSYSPIWLPFDMSDIKIRIAIFVVQFLNTTFSLCPGALAMFISWESTEMLILHIDKLKKHFTDISYKPYTRRGFGELRTCVNYHNHILNLADRLQVLIKYTNGHMTLLPAIIIACIGNQMLNSKVIGAVMYLVGYLGAFYCICQAGQRIQDETLSIGFAVYDSKWYEADAETIKDIMFIIARCQIPVLYKALPLGTADYPLFLMIMKTSYSYITLLGQST